MWIVKWYLLVDRFQEFYNVAKNCQEILRIPKIYEDLPCSREFLAIVSHAGKSDAKNFFLELPKAEKQRNGSL